MATEMHFTWDGGAECYVIWRTQFFWQSSARSHILSFSCGCTAAERRTLATIPQGIPRECANIGIEFRQHMSAIQKAEKAGVPFETAPLAGNHLKNSLTTQLPS